MRKYGGIALLIAIIWALFNLDNSSIPGRPTKRPPRGMPSTPSKSRSADLFRQVRWLTTGPLMGLRPQPITTSCN